MITRDGQRMAVQGRLTIETVPVVFNAGLQHLLADDLLLDLAQVEAVDSAAVAMLLGWMRAAQNGKRSFKVVGLPHDLLSLATLYGVADMLPVQLTDTSPI